MKKVLGSLFLLFTCFSAIASHIQGGEITYKCLGGNLYEVKLSYYWDCAAGFNPGASQSLNVSGCGQSLTMAVFQSTLTPGSGVSAIDLCPTTSTVTYCKNRIDYVGTITLPSACNSWTFSIGSCCRGGNLSNVSGATSAGYYHFATLNNLLVPCNNSPDFIMNYLPILCGNQPACLNMGAVDNDGHVLSYALVAAYQTASTFVTYSPGYTGAVPMTGIAIDPNTGIINFTPTIVGDFLVVVQVTEKDAAGNIIGTIIRDFPITVASCSNQIICGQGNISNPTAGTVPAGNNTTLEICPNMPFCFDVIFTDPDIGDSVKITSTNLIANFPGASIVTSYTPGVSNACKATICGTSSVSASNKHFTLMASDNVCPIMGTQFVNYNIHVLPATDAGKDFTLCGTQAATVNAVGSSTVFSWTDLSGNPIPVNSEFSCNPCHNPVIQPSITSTYVVTNIGGGAGCKNADTLIINVVPDFTLTTSQSNTVNTLGAQTSFSVVASPPGTYTYTWTPGIGLSNINSDTTTAIHSNAGMYTYSVMVQNSQGCHNIGVANSLSIAPVYVPRFSVTPSYTTSYTGGTVNLDVEFDTIPSSATCQLANLGCTLSNIMSIGNGTLTNSSSNYPAIFGNFYKNTRHQILYLVSELLAAGVQPGKISSIAFYVAQINGTSNYPDFTIKMKCTNVSDLSTNAFDQSGLTQVYYSSSINIVTGWNTYQFPIPYEWDGTSNILIDVCNSFTSTYSQNSLLPYTVTPFASVRWFNSDGSIACLANTGTTYSPNNTYRPNIRFGNCLSGANPNDYSYAWTPTIGLNNPNIKNPTVSVTGSQIYTVIVTATAVPTSSASGTATIDVVATNVNQDKNSHININVYPNPTNGLLVIENLNTPEINSVNIIDVTNALGEVVYKAKSYQQKTTLDLNSLNNGIYFITISNNMVKLLNKKIVIRK